MSAHVTTTIGCDRPGCPAGVTIDGWPGDARTAARRAGWTATDGDRCPAHPPGGEPAPPALFDLTGTAVPGG